MKRQRPLAPCLGALGAILCLLLLRVWLGPPAPSVELSSQPPTLPQPGAVDYDTVRQRLDGSARAYRPGEPLDFMDLTTDAYAVLRNLPGVHDLYARLTPEAPTARLIHVLNAPTPPPDWVTGEGPYLSESVGLLQASQGALLTCLAEWHGLHEVWAEGLDEGDVASFQMAAARLRDLEEELAATRASGGRAVMTEAQRQWAWRLGAPARLLAHGRLRTVLPLGAAAPPPDGGPTSEAYEDALIRRVLGHHPVAVLVLSGQRDLTSNLRRVAPSCQYIVVHPGFYVPATR